MLIGGGVGFRDYMGKKWSINVIVIYKWKLKWSLDVFEWLFKNCWSFFWRWWFLYLLCEKYIWRCVDDN